MITKYILLVWIGLGNSQTLSVETYDSAEECMAVAVVLSNEMAVGGWYKCLPYSYTPAN